MTFDDELARWSDDDADDLVAKLLRAGRADGPSARALRAAPTAVAALISTSSAAAAGLAPAGGVVSALATRASPLVLLKWVAVGSLSGASIMALVHAPNLMPAAPAVAASVMASPRPQVVPSRALPSVAVATQVAPPETANASPEPRASVQQADVAREVALLDAARAALVAGNVPKALRLLDALQRLPQRALGPEATVLRVRVLLARGERSEAQRVADAFYLQAGGSPQAGVLRSLLAQSVIQPSPPRL